METLAALSPHCRWNLLTLFIAGLLFWSSMGSQLPTLPLYIKEIGGNDQSVGIVMGSFAVGLLLSRSWLGKLADRRSRKLVLLIGMVVCTIAPLAYLIINGIPTAVALSSVAGEVIRPDSRHGVVLWLMGVRAFHGISIAAFATAYVTLVVDLSPPDHRGELIGYMSLVNPIGVAFGPFLGGLLQEQFGYAPLFIMASSLGLLGLACTALVHDAQDAVSEPGTPAPSRSNPEQFWSLLAHPRLKTPTLVLLLVGIAFGTLASYVPLLIENRQLAVNAGLFYLVAAIASFTTRVFLGRASDRYGRGMFITLSLGSYTLAMLTLCQVQSVPMLFLAAILEGSGFGILIPMFSSLLADRCEPKERGRVFGLCMGGFDLGIAIAGLIAGFVVQYAGYPAAFGMATGLALTSLVIFVTTANQNLSHSFRFAIGQGQDLYRVMR